MIPLNILYIVYIQTEQIEHIYRTNSYVLK